MQTHPGRPLHLQRAAHPSTAEGGSLFLVLRQMWGRQRILSVSVDCSSLPVQNDPYIEGHVWGCHILTSLNADKAYCCQLYAATTPVPGVF